MKNSTSSVQHLKALLGYWKCQNKMKKAGERERKKKKNDSTSIKVWEKLQMESTGGKFYFLLQRRDQDCEDVKTGRIKIKYNLLFFS